MKLTAHTTEFWGGPLHGETKGHCGPGEPLDRVTVCVFDREAWKTLRASSATLEVLPIVTIEYKLAILLPNLAVYVFHDDRSKPLRLLAEQYGWPMGYFLLTSDLFTDRLCADSDFQFCLSNARLDFDLCIGRLSRVCKPRRAA